MLDCSLNVVIGWSIPLLRSFFRLVLLYSWFPFFVMVYLPRMMEEPLFGVCCLFSLGWTINFILQSRFYSLYSLVWSFSVTDIQFSVICTMSDSSFRWTINSKLFISFLQINSHSCGAGYWFPPVMDDQLSFWCSSLVTSSWWTTPLLPRLFMLNDELSIWTIKPLRKSLLLNSKFSFLSSGSTWSTTLGKVSLVCPFPPA